jgi:butyrate kinase
MKTIIINNGSTSKKYALYEKDNLIYSSHYEKTPEGFVLNESFNSESIQTDIDERDFNEGFVDLKLGGLLLEL